MSVHQAVGRSRARDSSPFKPTLKPCSTFVCPISRRGQAARSTCFLFASALTRLHRHSGVGLVYGHPRATSPNRRKKIRSKNKTSQSSPLAHTPQRLYLFTSKPHLPTIFNHHPRFPIQPHLPNTLEYFCAFPNSHLIASDLSPARRFQGSGSSNRLSFRRH